MSHQTRARTHDENRALVCLMHEGPGASMKPISALDLARIREFVPGMADYDPDDQKLPCGLCARCRGWLSDLALKKRKDLPPKPDYSKSNFGGLTGRQLKDSQVCMCATICKLVQIKNCVPM